MNQLRQLLSFVLLICLVQYANGQGQTCATAEAVTPGTYTTAGPAANGGAGATGYTGGYAGMGVNADWYSYAATEDGVITISACLGGADTRLFVHTSCGDTAADPAYAENDDACPFAEGADNYASELVNIQVAAGTTYYIEWDDAWNGLAFEWTIGFEAITSDPAIIRPTVPFYHLPESQYATGIDLGVIASDLLGGSGDVTLSVEVLNFNGIVVYTDTSDVVTLGADEMVVTTGNWTPVSGTYTVNYTLHTTTDDPTPENNTYTISHSISATYGADGGPDNALGLNGSGAFWMGESYPILADDMLTSVSGFINVGTADITYAFEVYEIMPDGTVGAMLANSGEQILSEVGSSWITHDLTAPLAVTAGQTILVAVRLDVPDAPSSPSLGTYSENWIPGTSYANAGGGWIFIEDANFFFCFAMRANFGISSYNLTLHVDMNNETVSPDGVHAAGDFNGWDPAATPMTDDDGDGVYTVIIPDVVAGTEVQYRFINGNTMAGSEVVPAECGVDNGAGVMNRTIAMGIDNTEAEAVCFGACGLCVPGACAGAGVIFCDDLEAYDPTMPLGPASVWWSTWSGTEGGAEDGIVSTDQPYNGAQSMLIEGDNVDGGTQDVILALGDLNTGRYEFSFWMYVPADSGAYYNILHAFPPTNGDYAFQVDFSPDGNVYLDAGAADAAVVPYTHDAWFQVHHTIDLDNDWIGLSIGDSPIYQWPYSWTTFTQAGLGVLSTVDFFPISDVYKFYVDDVLLRELPAVPAGDDCAAAVDLTYMLGGGVEMPVVSDIIFDNTMATVSGFDPVEGWECFGDVPNGLDNTLWYTFIGDGSEYYITSIACDATNYIPAGDTQMAIYEGGCNGDAVALLCSEDAEVTPTGEYPMGDYFQTEEGVTYYMMVDGWRDGDMPSVGEFCIEMTQQPIPVVNLTLSVYMGVEIENGDLDPATGVVTVVGSWSGLTEFNQMTDDDGDGVYTITIPVTAGMEYSYLFVNGDGFGGLEGVDASCTVVVNNVNFRPITVGSEDVEVAMVCFGDCASTPCVVGIDELSFSNALDLFPNPATDVATLNYNFSERLEINVRITNSLGQVVKTHNLGNVQNGTLNMDVTDFATGMYFVDITDGQNSVTKKLFVD